MCIYYVPINSCLWPSATLATESTMVAMAAELQYSPSCLGFLQPRRAHQAVSVAVTIAGSAPLEHKLFHNGVPPVKQHEFQSSTQVYTANQLRNMKL